MEGGSAGGPEFLESDREERGEGPVEWRYVGCVGSVEVGGGGVAILRTGKGGETGFGWVVVATGAGTEGALGGNFGGAAAVVDGAETVGEGAYPP